MRDRLNNRRAAGRYFLAAAALCMSVVFAAGQASGENQSAAPETTARVADHRERVECSAVAVIVSGRRVPGYEAKARGPNGADACRKALAQCKMLLDEARSSTGLALPSAECQPLETTQLIPDPIEPATATTASTPERSNENQAQVADPSCNINVCSRRYRSFRASDCTFQPYNGPRRRCRF